MTTITSGPGAETPGLRSRLAAARAANPIPSVVVIVLAGVYVAAGAAAVFDGLSSDVLIGILGVTFAAALAVLAYERFWWFLMVLLVSRAALDGIRSSASQAGQLDPSTIVGAVFLVVGAGWLVVQWRAGLWSKVSRTTKVFAIFAGLLLISAFGAHNMKDSLVACSRILSVVILIAVFEQVFRKDPERINGALVAIFASMIVPIVVGYVQVIQNPSNLKAANENLSRIRATFVHPNAFATYLVLVTLLAVGMYPHVSVKWRRAFMALIVAAAPLIVLTYARGAWIGLVLGLFFLGFVQSPRLVVFLLIGIIVVVIAVPSVASRLGDLNRGKSKPIGTRGASISSTVTAKVEPDSLTWRVDYWGRVIPLIGQNPVTGIGLEMVREVTPEHEPPHNVYVQTLVEGGIAGFTAFILLLLTLVFDLRNAWRRARKGLPYGLTIAVIAAAICVFVELFTENLLAEIALLWYFFVPIAWVVSVVGRPGPVPRDMSHVEIEAHA
ncbi:MAG TPA: O-antigen ligase family protein [Acidimicrobiia bacterium]|nr:O-antigen ligase family protein [Acidimicrobiia bacterium]